MNRFPALVWIGLAAAAAMIVGAFGPWAKVFVMSVSGTDGTNDGWFVVLAAVAGGAALIAYAKRERFVLALCVLLTGAVGLAVTIYDRNNVSDIGEGSDLAGIVEIGWGLNLAMAASIVLSVVGLIALSREIRFRR